MMDTRRAGSSRGGAIQRSQHAAANFGRAAISRCARANQHRQLCAPMRMTGREPSSALEKSWRCRGREFRLRSCVSANAAIGFTGEPEAPVCATRATPCRRDFRARRQQAHHGKGKHGFRCVRFAHKAQGFWPTPSVKETSSTGRIHPAGVETPDGESAKFDERSHRSCTAGCKYSPHPSSYCGL